MNGYNATTFIYSSSNSSGNSSGKYVLFWNGEDSISASAGRNELKSYSADDELSAEADDDSGSADSADNGSVSADGTLGESALLGTMRSWGSMENACGVVVVFMCLSDFLRSFHPGVRHTLFYSLNHRVHLHFQ
mgnify:CR=1